MNAIDSAIITDNAADGGCRAASCCLSLPEPYYDRDGITIYQGDCRQIMPLLGRFDLLLADPPYGIGADVMQSKRGGKQGGKALAPSRDYGASNWDAEPVDEWAMMLARTICAKQVIFGGNYYALPPSKCWLVWDKANGENTYADCELAWTNLEKAVRRKVHQWHGMLRKGGEDRHHPTQKPLEVIQWAIQQAGDVETILDPWAGSGTTGHAAKNLGKRCVMIEREERYCEIAALRLAQDVLPLFPDNPRRPPF